MTEYEEEICTQLGIPFTPLTGEPNPVKRKQINDMLMEKERRFKEKERLEKEKSKKKKKPDILYNVNGEELSLSEIRKKYGVNKYDFIKKLNMGLTPDDIIRITANKSK